MKTLFQVIKKRLPIFTLVSLLGTQISHAAVDCTQYGEHVLDPNLTEDVLFLLCPLQGAINIGLFFVGAVLVILVLYGAIKAVTSVGDPKQLEGAKMVWTHALFGFLIIVFSISLIIIAARLMGSDINPLNVTNSIDDAFTKFYNDLESPLPVTIINEPPTPVNP